MDLDGALDRYLRNPDVARWLFCKDDVRTVTPDAMSSSFVYAIGWGMYPPGAPRTMNIEDMLILTGQTGNFVLGVIWGLSQPHVFAQTPLMLKKKPLARRFAVDFSCREALEFMEFATFEDGKVVVMFRQFIHTLDLSLPCLACARLHAASKVEQTLGPVLMRADLFEAACCPRCGQVGKGCLCSFDSYAPNATVRKSTYTWNQFTTAFMRKARVGTIKLRMTAMLPDVGELRIVDDEIPVLNVLQKGDTEYMNLLRTKAVHGLGVTVIMPRADTLVMAKAIESDFIDLHNSYVMRKRIRETDDEEDGDELVQTVLQQPTDTLDFTQAPDFLGEAFGPTNSDSIESVEDFLSIFPSMISTATSPRHPNILASAQQAVVMELRDPVPEPEPDIPLVDESFDPFAKTELDPELVSAELLMSPNMTVASDTNVMEQPDVIEQPNVMEQPAVAKADFMTSIELILSPPSSQEQAAPAQPPLQDQIPLELLTNPFNTNNGLLSSSVSSDNSTREIPAAEGPSSTSAERGSTTTAAPVARRKKRTKRQPNDGDNGTEKKHACTRCAKRFKNRGDLLRHVKVVHEGKRIYICETCGKDFGHSGHLNRHIQSVHLHQRRFQCKFCGFEFYQASHLQSHIGHIHGKKKSFSCKDCGYRASSQNALRTHINKLHSSPPEKPVLGCPFTDCGEAFSRDSDLSLHMFSAHNSGINSNFMGLAQRRQEHA